MAQQKHFSNHISEYYSEKNSIKNGTGRNKTENVIPVPSEKENLRTETLLSCKCLTYRKLIILKFS